jgi:hypothetical protein
VFSLGFRGGHRKKSRPEEFTGRYRAILRHYGLEGTKIQTGEAHENGDIEQRGEK